MEQPKRNPTGIPLWDPSGARDPSRRLARDMAALLALPAMWVDHDPAEIGTGLLGILFGMLNLESAYVRFADPSGPSPLECWRPIGAAPPPELASVLAEFAGETPQSMAGTIRTEESGALRVLSLPLSLPHGNTLILAASRHSDFPSDVEMHLLRIAVGQAVISIYTARLLAAERAARAAAESALRHQNAFLAGIAQDLATIGPLLSDRARQAGTLSSERVTSRSAPEAVVAGSAVADRSSAPQAGPVPARLTRREVEVLGLLAQGLSNKEIAAVMWLSDRTVERHITSLYRKIGVARRSEATAFVLRNGLFESGNP